MRDERKITWFGPCCEAVGVLEKVDLEKGLLNFEGFSVAISPELISELLPELEGQLGRKIAILRTDILDRPLLLRILNAHGDAEMEG